MLKILDLLWDVHCGTFMKFSSDDITKILLLNSEKDEIDTIGQIGNIKAIWGLNSERFLNR